MINFEIIIPKIRENEINTRIKRTAKNWIDAVSPLVKVLEKGSVDIIKLKCQVLSPGKMKVNVEGSSRYFLVNNPNIIASQTEDELENESNVMPDSLFLDQTETENQDAQSHEKLFFAFDSVDQMIEPEFIAQFILDTCEDFVAAEASSIVMLNEFKESYSFIAVTGPAGEELFHKKFPKEKGIIGFAIEHSIRVHLEDTQEDERFAKDVAEKIGFPVRDIFCVPVLVKDEVIGALEFLNSKGKNGFSELDKSAASFAAKTLGQRLEKL